MPKSLDALVSMASGRREAGLKAKCATCRATAVLKALRDLERDLARHPDKYEGVTMGDIHVWSGAKEAGITKESLKGHLAKHQPGIGRALGWRA